MKSASTPLSALRTSQCLQMGIVLAVASAACLILINRMSQIPNWLPSPPVTIGAWEAVSIPPSGDMRNLLGNPPLESREYRNPLDDKVTVQFVVPKTFDAYREPPELAQSFAISAQRLLPLFGSDKPVRAWVWKGRYNTKAKAIMLCWIQERSGGTRVFGLRGLQQTFLERLQISRDALTNNQERCIVRVYSLVHPNDEDGAQTRRNVEEVARGIYASLRSVQGGTP